MAKLMTAKTSERYKQILIGPNIPLIEALKQMDEAALQVLVVVDDGDRLLGVVTDGDVRRGIINGVGFQEPVSTIMNAGAITLPSPVDKNRAIELMKRYEIRHIPVVGKENKVVGLLLWKDFLNNGEVSYASKNTVVVIMAGGEGTRLQPFTKILPKPLIPVGERPIIDTVMDNFKRHGFHRFLISLNYKAEMIKMYLSERMDDCEIRYIHEKEYTGTAGSLSLAKNELTDTFIVSNCDVIIDADFDNLLNYHRKNKSKATLLGAVRHMKIPYGVLSMHNGDLDEISEKPEYHFIVNSGIYVLEPGIVDLIPENRPMDMPCLLQAAQNEGFKVQVYPVSCSWFDVGEWEEYKRAVEHVNKYGTVTLRG